MQKYFSYEIIVSELSLKENIYNFSADKSDLAYLASLLDVEGVLYFDAKISVKVDKKKNILTVNGVVSSEVVLKSVISLENFSKEYKLPFEVKYDMSAKPEDFDGVEFDLEEEVLDVIVGGKIDLADLAIEQLALCLDEYPRKEGEVFEFESEFDVDDKPNPFNVLEKLKK